MNKNFLQILMGFFFIFSISGFPASSINRFVVHTRTLDVEEGYHARRVIYRGRVLTPSETVTETDKQGKFGGEASTFWINPLDDPGAPGLPSESYVVQWDRVQRPNPESCCSRWTRRILWCPLTCGLSLCGCCDQGNDPVTTKNARSLRGKLPKNPSEVEAAVHIWYGYTKKGGHSLTPSAGLKTPLLSTQ
jgi:hypothetical protein